MTIRVYDCDVCVTHLCLVGSSIIAYRTKKLTEVHLSFLDAYFLLFSFLFC